MSGNVILTNAGRYFDFNNPEAHPYTLREIAHSLSQINRFTGHTEIPYNVAVHSVLVLRILRNKGYTVNVLRWGIMHDATEAYVGDMASPLKAMNPGYKVIENRVGACIASCYRMELPEPLPVKWADTVALVAERKRFLPAGDVGNHWPEIRAFDVACAGDLLDGLADETQNFKHNLCRDLFLAEAVRYV